MKRFLLATIFLGLTLFMSSATASASVVSSSDKKAPPDIGQIAPCLHTDAVFVCYTITFTDATALSPLGYAYHTDSAVSSANQESAMLICSSGNSPAGLFSWRLCPQGTASSNHSIREGKFISYKAGKHPYTDSKHPYRGFQRYWCKK